MAVRVVEQQLEKLVTEARGTELLKSFQESSIVQRMKKNEDPNLLNDCQLDFQTMYTDSTESGVLSSYFRQSLTCL